jgi:hypothetical protein
VYLLHWFFWWGGSKGNKERIPQSHAFVGVRKRNQEGKCACCTGFLMGWNNGIKE